MVYIRFETFRENLRCREFPDTLCNPKPLFQTSGHRIQFRIDHLTDLRSRAPGIPIMDLIFSRLGQALITT
ncbi:hypothetical protein LV85_03907 [Algoriphagus chordae]|uniref:Uncharacterized protein n=1 Tax=Algoriphagus chordae TaxID=237019 RepID=A0A2W7QGA3_9BACT|nr:hypothetical protein LV85_03907 [Algoriphagus chordae]